jgi:Uma2 family endonuclease
VPTETKLLTFAEFDQIPNPPGAVFELRHGQLAAVTFPKQHHVRAQWQLRRLLEKAVGDRGAVHTEVPFRPLPEYECWGADIAYVSRERWDSIDQWLFGVPEIVIEVLSPSNTAAEMREREKICLDNGGKEFWVVDTERRHVKVSTPDGRTLTYSAGQEIPLFFGGSVAVDAIFA